MAMSESKTSFHFNINCISVSIIMFALLLLLLAVADDLNVDFIVFAPLGRKVLSSTDNNVGAGPDIFHLQTSSAVFHQPSPVNPSMA